MPEPILTCRLVPYTTLAGARERKPRVGVGYGVKTKRGPRPVTCHQIFARAERHMDAGKRGSSHPPRKQAEIADRFFTACQNGEPIFLGADRMRSAARARGTCRAAGERVRISPREAGTSSPEPF